MPRMIFMRVIGAGLAIAGILPATAAVAYAVGGTWLITNLNHTIRLVSIGIVGALMVWLGLWMWYKPLRDTRRNLNQADT